MFNANAAWTVLAVLAHNLGRWTLAAAGGHGADATVGSLRRRLTAMPARLVSSGRRLRLRPPANWPWRPALQRAHPYPPEKCRHLTDTAGRCQGGLRQRGRPLGSSAVAPGEGTAGCTLATLFSTPTRPPPLLLYTPPADTEPLSGQRKPIRAWCGHR